jgi:hypothetical protein
MRLFPVLLISTVVAALWGCGLSVSYVVRGGAQDGTEADARGIQAIYERMIVGKLDGKVVPEIKFSRFLPPVSRRCATPGEVRILAHIDSSNGKFTNVRVIGSTSDTETAALFQNSVAKWEFVPFTVDGRTKIFEIEIPFVVGKTYC